VNKVLSRVTVIYSFTSNFNRAVSVEVILILVFRTILVEESVAEHLSLERSALVVLPSKLKRVSQS